MTYFHLSLDSLSLQRLLVVEAFVIAPRARAEEQAGRDPASAYRSCLFNCPLHGCQHFQAVGPSSSGVPTVRKEREGEESDAGGKGRAHRAKSPK